MLKNIESTNIRPEFKVRIYTQYAMSSIRFALTVHDLTSTQRKSLDSLTTRYLKSWLGMPKDPLWVLHLFILYIMISCNVSMLMKSIVFANDTDLFYPGDNSITSM